LAGKLQVMVTSVNSRKVEQAVAVVLVRLVVYLCRCAGTGETCVG
jgi:hypothetical protein